MASQLPIKGFEVDHPQLGPALKQSGISPAALQRSMPEIYDQLQNPPASGKVYIPIETLARNPDALRPALPFARINGGHNAVEAAAVAEKQIEAFDAFIKRHAAGESGGAEAETTDATRQPEDEAPPENDVPPEVEDKQFNQHINAVSSKLPQEWQTSTPNRKGIGFRWQDPKNPGNRVRVDKGNAGNSQPSQQEDHVVVHSNGKILGRDGKPIKVRIKDDPENSHIPLHEYMDWKKWNSPT